MRAKNNIVLKQIDGKTKLDTIFNDILFTKDFVIIDFEKFASESDENFDKNVKKLCKDIYEKLKEEREEFLKNNDVVDMYVDIKLNGWDQTWYALTEENEIICAGFLSANECKKEVKFLIPDQRIEFYIDDWR